MPKVHRIKLTSEEREELTEFTERKRVAGAKVLKARSLLLADESEQGSGARDAEIIKATGIKPSTLCRLRQRCCEVGPLAALERKAQAQPSRKSLVTGDIEARLTVIACSEAPDGTKRWSLRLLADKLVELEIVESISHETVRKTLKKTLSNRG